MAEVVTPNSAPSGGGRLSSMSPALWAYVWVGFAAFVLIFLHLAIMGRGR